jgi:hypothetical protein
VTGRVVLFSGWYSPALCARNPGLLFVFGDNTLSFGMGGQAVIRQCSNVFGIPTKRKPAMTEDSFFAAGNEADLDVVLKALSELWSMLALGDKIVIPVNAEGKISLGLERAELPKRAPLIYEAIERHVGEMIANYGELPASVIKVVA